MAGHRKRKLRHHKQNPLTQPLNRAGTSSSARVATDNQRQQVQEHNPHKNDIPFNPNIGYKDKIIRRKKAVLAEKKREIHPLKNAKKITLLQRFPKEVVDLILRHTLTHSRAIPVNPLFVRENQQLPPALDYRVLHTCRQLYTTGIQYYYALNTFSISLKLFELGHETLKPPRWPYQCGLSLASKLVRSIKISSRKWGYWHKSIDLIRGFEHLEKIVFDSRGDEGIDDGNDDGMLYDAWEEIPASKELCDGLNEAGIHVGSGGVWVGAGCAREAEIDMEGVITLHIYERLGISRPAKARITA